MRAATALGRIGDPRAVAALCDALDESDVYARFATVQALRRLNRWSGALACLKSAKQPVRDTMLLALTGVYDQAAVEALCTAVVEVRDPGFQVKAIEALAEVCRQADPYTGGWWGTQPAAGKPARSKTHDWPGTQLVLARLPDLTREGQPEAVRKAAVAALVEVNAPHVTERFLEMLLADPSDEVRREVVKGLGTLRNRTAVPALLNLADDERRGESLRQDALRAVGAIGSSEGIAKLAALVADDNTSPALAVLGLETLGELASADGLSAVEHRLDSPRPLERAKAITAYAAIRGAAGQAVIAKKLTDGEASVRQAALAALAKLHATEAVPAMIAAAADPAVRFEAIQALAAMPDHRALPIYLDGLVDKNQGLREASRTALILLRQAIGPDVIELHKRHELSQSVRAALQEVFSAPAPITGWQFLGSWPKSAAPRFDTARAPNLKRPIVVDGRELKWQPLNTEHPQGRISLQSLLSPNSDCWGMGYAAIDAAEPGRAELIIGSDDQALVWLNGVKVLDFDGNRGWNWESDRVAVELRAGVNHVWFQVGNDGGPWEFSLNIRRREPRFAFLYENVPPKLNLSAYRDYALANTGNPAHGRLLFTDLKGVACIKCHSVAGDGGKVGPDLAGIAAKYPREELIRSVLEPSNRIADGYQMTVITTTSGKVFQGLVKSDTDQAVELADIDAKLIRIPKRDIDDRTRSNLSLMPSGLNEGMTLADFADVVAYLQSLKK